MMMMRMMMNRQGAIDFNMLDQLAIMANTKNASKRTQ